MNVAIDRVVPRYVPRVPPSTRLFEHDGGLSAVVDIEAMVAQVEVHAGSRSAALQIATGNSGWIVVALGAGCVVETITASVRIAVDEGFLLPPGTPTLLLGEAWLAVRVLPARLPPVTHQASPWLARHAVRLADVLRAEDSPFAVAQRGRMATRLLRELEHVRRDVVSAGEAMAR